MKFRRGLCSGERSVLSNFSLFLFMRMASKGFFLNLNLRISTFRSLICFSRSISARNFMMLYILLLLLPSASFNVVGILCFSLYVVYLVHSSIMCFTDIVVEQVSQILGSVLLRMCSCVNLVCPILSLEITICSFRSSGTFHLLVSSLISRNLLLVFWYQLFDHSFLIWFFMIDFRSSGGMLIFSMLRRLHHFLLYLRVMGST